MRIGRCNGSDPRKTMNLVTAAANSNASPQYNAHRPITESTGGGGLLTTVAVAPPRGCAFTPNVNEPAVVWPSSSETVRHVTVNTPSGSDPTPIWISRGVPLTGWTWPFA